MLFAGTTEGRDLSHFMYVQGIPVSIYTATRYGAEALRDAGVAAGPAGTGVTINTGRLDEAAVRAEIIKNRPIAVIDATHPFAEEAGRTIRRCCCDCDTPLIKVLRPEIPMLGRGAVTRTKNVAEAAEYLSSKKGNILLTIGSRRLDIFCKAFLRNNGAEASTDELDRLCVRILPVPDSLRICIDCGIRPRNIMAVEGPFSEDMNLSCIRHFDAAYLVTKETGYEGGMCEKLSAAEKAGIEVVTVMRPPSEGGVSVDEAKEMIAALWDDSCSLA